MPITARAPVDLEEKEKIYRFLYEIWAEEFQRDMDGMDHEARTMRDDLDEWCSHFLAVDESGHIVGCMRNNYFARGNPTADLNQKMQLDKLFEIFARDKIGFTSHLALEPLARGKTVTSQLIFTAFREGFELGVEIAICYAALNLVPLYYQLGFRPYCSNFRLPFGTRVPLVLCCRDIDYLKTVRSPLVQLIPPNIDDGGRSAKQLAEAFPLFTNPGFDRHSTRALWARLAHLNTELESQQSYNLFRGFSQPELTELTAHLTRLTFEANETIYKRNEAEAGMGVLLSGSLGIGVGDVDNPHIVSVIRPGEPFGELASLGLKRHSSDVLALENSEVLLFPKKFIEKVSGKGDGIGLRLTQNLLYILARRADASNLLFSKLTGKGDQQVQIRRKSPFQNASLKAVKSRVESYHFDTLVNREQEYERLVLQATVAESLEFGRLRDLGLKNGDTIVDLGSGPGITSTLLAKYFPGSQIIGVEPETELRERAEAFVDRQQISQCSFLEGTAENMPIKDATADFCYARLLFQHLPNPVAALKEMKRITKPGGILTVLDVDDGTIITHPEFEGLREAQKEVARVQAEYGGNRYIGRELSMHMTQAGLEGVHIDPIPITTRELHGPLFYQIVFGFKRQILERAGAWTEATKTAFKNAEKAMQDPTTFAMVVLILAHSRAPN